MGKDVVVHGAIYSTEPCSLCGKANKRSAPILRVVFAVNMKRFEIRDMDNYKDVHHMKNWRVISEMCMACAEKFADKLDQGIEEARFQREKFYERV